MMVLWIKPTKYSYITAQAQKRFLIWPTKQKAEERWWRLCLCDRQISAGQQSSPRARGPQFMLHYLVRLHKALSGLLQRQSWFSQNQSKNLSRKNIFLFAYMLLNTSATCQWYIKYVFSQNKQKFSGELWLSAVIWLKQKWRVWKQDIKHGFESEARGGTLLCAVRIRSADRIWQLPTLRDSPTRALSSLILMSRTVVS